MVSKSYEWKLKNRSKWLAEKKKYREKHKSQNDKELNLIRVHSVRWVKPFLISKYGGCQFCKSMERLEIHHINYTTNIEDILLLCSKCHIQIHKNKLGDNHNKKSVIKEV